MRGLDHAILAVFTLICTLLYLGVMLALPTNRRQFRRVVVGGAAVLLGTAALWFTVFVSPFARNWGLGGSYVWMAVCPALFALVGVAVTVRNLCREGK